MIVLVWNQKQRVASRENGRTRHFFVSRCCNARRFCRFFPFSEERTKEANKKAAFGGGPRNNGKETTKPTTAASTHPPLCSLSLANRCFRDVERIVASGWLERDGSDSVIDARRSTRFSWSHHRTRVSRSRNAPAQTKSCPNLFLGLPGRRPAARRIRRNPAVRANGRESFVRDAPGPEKTMFETGKANETINVLVPPQSVKR